MKDRSEKLRSMAQQSTAHPTRRLTNSWEAVEHTTSSISARITVLAHLLNVQLPVTLRMP